MFLLFNYVYAVKEENRSSLKLEKVNHIIVLSRQVNIPDDDKYFLCYILKKMILHTYDEYLKTQVSYLLLLLFR